MTDPIHSELTRRSNYGYLFHSKHHGGGSSSDAQWAGEITRAEEFSVFDAADFHDISDERGWLYGILRDTEGELREIGTWQQQIAEFPKANPGTPWHGYPIWTLNQQAPPNRSGEKMRPAKEVFNKLESAGLINARQRKRLYKGDHV